MQNTNIKRYTVSESWKDYSVTLEVNHDILTAERAEQINQFWSGDRYRLQKENGDVVRTVIRLAGQHLIGMMLNEGGTSFTEATNRPFDNPGPIWTEDLQNEEGWGGSEGGPFGWCGIRCIAADVEVPDYHDVELAEVAHG